MNDSITLFKTLYTAGEVQRCHTQRVLHRQSNAEHSWGVALVLMWLFRGWPSERLLMRALTHDSAECITGDVPATSKWYNPELNEQLDIIERRFNVEHGIDFALTVFEEAAFSFADSIELTLYCIAEVNMGNLRMSLIGDNAAGAARTKMTMLMEDSDVFHRAQELLILVGG